MNPRLWPYFLKQALQSISKNRGVHIIGLGTMVVCLLIFGSFLLLFVNLNTWVQGLGHSFSLSVYLSQDASHEQKENLGEFLRNIKGAEIQRFVTEEEAFHELKEALGSQAELLEGIPENILPASFEVVIRTSDADKFDATQIKRSIERREEVEEVLGSEDWFERFEGITRMVRLLGIAIGILLCMGVLLIVTNTIKLTIYSRKNEVEIMKLVGATDWFVKIPFLFEGLLQGVTSGIISLLILFGGYLLLSLQKINFLNFALLEFVFIPQQHVIAILLVSASLGLLGSFIAVGRFFDI